MFLVPVVDHWQVRAPPWTVYVLIALNVLVYLLSVIFSTIDHAAFKLGLVLNDFSPLRLFSSWFAHAGFWHLAWNMFFLFMFGSPVEQVLGHARTLLVYVVAGILSSLVYCVVPMGGWALQIGASGAICGLVGTFGILLRRETVNLQAWFFIIRVWQTDVSALTAVVLWLLAQLAFGMLASMLGIVGGTGYAAHVTGLLTGIGFGIFRLHQQQASAATTNQPSARSIRCSSCGGLAQLKVDSMYRCQKCSRWLTRTGQPLSR